MISKLPILQCNLPDPRALLVFITLFCLAGLKVFSQCSVDIDFNDWSEAGQLENGEWDITSNGEEVIQLVNGNPTFFIGQNDFMNVRITGSIQVDSDTFDDDFVGFVFSALSPTGTSNGSDTSLDLWLLDWKGSFQSTANEGFSLIRIEDTYDFSEDADFSPFFWTHGSNEGFDIKEQVLGEGMGWVPGQVHNFELLLKSNRVTIIIDGTEIIDREDCFNVGKFGFYNFSQENVTYSNFSYELVTEFSIPNQICINENFNPSIFSTDCTEIDETAISDIISNWFWQFGDESYSFQMLPEHEYEDPGEYEITLTVTDFFGCSAESSQTIIVEQKAEVSISDPTGCEGDFFSFSAYDENSATPIIGYAWDFNGDGITDESGSEANYLFNSPGEHSISVIAMAVGCNDTATVNIIVNPIPEVNFEIAKIAGRTIRLENLSLNASEYSWDLGDGNLSSEESLTHTYEDDSEYLISLTAFNDGCENTVSKSMAIYFEDTTFIPTAFTPNGDGTNDLFRILGSDLTQIEMNVFNIWGQLIYRGTDLGNGWDGTINGKEAQSGNYTYVISGENFIGTKKKYKGLVALIR